MIEAKQKFIKHEALDEDFKLPSEDELYKLLERDQLQHFVARLRLSHPLNDKEILETARGLKSIKEELL